MPVSDAVPSEHGLRVQRTPPSILEFEANNGITVIFTDPLVASPFTFVVVLSYATSEGGTARLKEEGIVGVVAYVRQLTQYHHVGALPIYLGTTRDGPMVPPAAGWLAYPPRDAARDLSRPFHLGKFGNKSGTTNRLNSHLVSLSYPTGQLPSFLHLLDLALGHHSKAAVLPLRQQQRSKSPLSPIKPASSFFDLFTPPLRPPSLYSLLSMSAQPNLAIETATPSGARTPGQDSVTLRSEEGAADEKKQTSQDNTRTPLDAEKAESIEGEKVVALGPGQDESKLVHGWKLITIFIGMLLSIFLVALDQTIVATAIPRIASEFNALEQVTWIASAYFLTQAGLMLTYGQLLRVAPTKYVYLTAVGIFEVGSAICGAAPTINVLIFGRAFAGVGAAGIFVSCLSIIAVITKLEQRPLLFGLFGGVFALSSVIGPLMGGAFTDHVSWRWCFYINLPFGAITVTSILFFVKAEHSIAPRTSNSGAPTWRRLITNIDWFGSFLCLAMVTSLLLPLQWGGVTKAWTDKSVIACFVVFAVLLLGWIAWEWYMGDNAVMPLSLFKRRTQVGACLEAFFIMLILLCCAYYLPLYYQSAEEHSATRSGIDILIYMIMVVVGAAVGGGIINFTGRPLPFLIGSPVLASIGAGVVFWCLTKKPSPSILYGCQVLLGLGIGGAMQNTIIAIQAEYVNEPEMVPQSTSLVNFTQLVGGIIGIAISGTIFGNQLKKSLTHYAPNLDPELAAAVKQSVQVIYGLTGDDKAHVIRAYSEALGYVFILAIPCGILASVSGVLIKNYNLKEIKLQPGMAAA